MSTNTMVKGWVTRNPYMWLGLGLTVAGAVISPVFYFILDSVPLSALGISFLMLGLTCIALANTRPPISPEASQMILQTGIENISSLLEELGLTGKAVYLPPSLRNGRAQALIPLRQDQGAPQINGRIPGRLIVRYGNNPEDLGIAITTPGSLCLEGLEIQPGPTSTELSAVLTHVVVGMLDIASSLTVNTYDSRVSIEVSNPRLSYQNIWFYRSLGSPLASIAATVASEALDKPIMVESEESHGKKSVIKLEVMT